MTRGNLETALRAACRLARETDFFLIGSQAVHAYCRRPPAEVLLSQECDLYPVNRPEAANLLDARLGRNSAFARRHGFYVDVVTPELASLPNAWQSRLKPLAVGSIRAHCLDIHDLIVGKLAVGRLKDLEFIGALLRLGIAKAETVHLRIRQMSPERERRVLRGRLQSVLADL